jgi:peptidoglycan-associated lipoprotein
MTPRLSWARTATSLALVATLAACSSIDLAENQDVNNGNAPNAMAVSQTYASPATDAPAASGVAGVSLDAAQQGADFAADLAKVLYFDFDSYALRDEYAATLAAHAQRLIENRDRRVALAGHTDESGSREYNLSLGQQRAEAVRRALVLLGAQDSQVEATSYGEEKPASLGGDETSRSLNRRVEISYR